MISEPTQLSILLTSHIPKDTLLKLIDDVGSLKSRSVEMIMMDDGMLPETHRAVAEAIRQTGSDSFFLYEHDRSYGRGNSLNEALTQASGTFVWAPTKAEYFREMLLEDALKKIDGELEAFYGLDYRIPTSDGEWLEKIRNGLMPPDECFIWNRERIASQDLHFNPFLNQHFGAELALRLSSTYPFRTMDPFFVVSGDLDQPLGTRDIQEFLFSLLRMAGESTENETRREVISYLHDLESDEKRQYSEKSQLAEAAEWMERGENSEAMKRVSVYLQRNPGDIEATRMKIHLLERLRRHVEASELKHRLKERSLFDDVGRGAGDVKGRVRPGSVDENADKDAVGDAAHETDHDSTQGMGDAVGDAGHDASLDTLDTGHDVANNASRNVARDVTGDAAGDAPDAPEAVAEGAFEENGYSHGNKGKETSKERKVEPTPKLNDEDILVSVIIPTTGHGKRLLENTLIHLARAADPGHTELIIIDNASLDDTLIYLEQLKNDNFLNIRVLPQSVNKGFGPSVNLGLDAAKGSYLLVLHSDIELEPDTIQHLQELMDSDPEVVMSVPMVTDSRNEEQLPEQISGQKSVSITSADSACFMLRKENRVRFDERFFPAYFDMEDFCRQIMSGDETTTGMTSANSTGTTSATSTRTNTSTTTGTISATGLTTVKQVAPSVSDMMGLRLIPQIKWSNRMAYLEKWGDLPDINMPVQGTPPDRFERLGSPIHPEKPDQAWLDAVNNYLTSEVRTEILRSEYTENEWITIISTLMMADQRELMRTLEDRLDDMDLPVSLLVLLINYYFKKNIYSRCQFYLEKAGKKHAIFDMYRLRIAISDKEGKKATALLSTLIKQFPSNPDLLFMASELYRQSGEEGEAEAFRKMAHQMDPKRFSADFNYFKIL